MNRRGFLTRLGCAPLAAPLVASCGLGGGGSAVARPGLTLFLVDDVMTGRGIDQVLASSVDPAVYEPYVRDARDHVRLAERENGGIHYRMHPENTAAGVDVCVLGNNHVMDWGRPGLLETISTLRACHGPDRPVHGHRDGGLHAGVHPSPPAGRCA